MSNTSRRGALVYEAETVHGEDATTFATHRPPITVGIDLTGLRHDKIAPDRVTQRMNETTNHIIGPQGGSFKTRLWNHGHGVTTSGSPTVDAVETFLAYALGNPTSNGTLSASASQTFTGTGSVTAAGTSGASGFAAGGLFRAGVKGDGGGDGQMYPCSTQGSSLMNCLIALAALPANGALLLPCVNFFGPEDPTGTPTVITALRFRAMTANLNVEMHGCYPTALEFGGLNTGEIPYIEITWGVSWWRYTATTLPSAVASNQYQPAPVANGSFAINTVVAGVPTTTRALRSIRDFKISVNLNTAMLPGPGGAGPYQVCIGAKRLPSPTTITWMEDADAATASPVLDGYWTGTNRFHLMYTLSTTAGSAVGFYVPNMGAVGPRPMQVTGSDGVNRLPITMECGTGPTTTTDLTLSQWRMGWG